MAIAPKCPDCGVRMAEVPAPNAWGGKDHWRFVCESCGHESTATHAPKMIKDGAKGAEVKGLTGTLPEDIHWKDNVTWTGQREGLCLHLGAGTRQYPGYLSVDSRDRVDPDVVANVEDLGVFEDGVASIIYACHVLEHIPRPHVLDTLEEWRRVLKPGGVLRLSVPDFHVLAELYLYDGVSMWRLIGPLMGGQDYDGNFHHIAFDKEYLSWLLTEAGFIDVRPWQPYQVHPSCYDDFSKAKIDGRLISLNLEAVAK